MCELWSSGNCTRAVCAFRHCVLDVSSSSTINALGFSTVYRCSVGTNTLFENPKFGVIGCRAQQCITMTFIVYTVQVQTVAHTYSVHVHTFVFCCPAAKFDKQICSHQKGGGIRGVEQWIRMATEYKMVILPDMGGIRPCIECPQYIYFTEAGTL